MSSPISSTLSMLTVQANFVMSPFISLRLARAHSKLKKLERKVQAGIQSPCGEHGWFCTHRICSLNLQSDWKAEIKKCYEDHLTLSQEIAFQRMITIVLRLLSVWHFVICIVTCKVGTLLFRIHLNFRVLLAPQIRQNMTTKPCLEHGLACPVL